MFLLKDDPCSPEKDFSRESSVEQERPASQASGAGKRKNSPKFHFLKNRRKAIQVTKQGRKKWRHKTDVTCSRMDGVRDGFG